MLSQKILKIVRYLTNIKDCQKVAPASNHSSNPQTRYNLEAILRGQPKSLNYMVCRRINDRKSMRIRKIDIFKHTITNCLMFPPHATSWRKPKVRLTSAPTDLATLTNNSAGTTRRGTLDGDLFPGTEKRCYELDIKHQCTQYCESIEVVITIYVISPVY